MRVHKTYSINIEVVKAFEEIVENNQRSRVLDALMLEYLIKNYTEGVENPQYDDSSLTTEKEKVL
jgi:hypothetical protein